MIAWAMRLLRRNTQAAAQPDGYAKYERQAKERDAWEEMRELELRNKPKMTGITRRHVAIAKKYLSGVEQEHQQAAQEILEYLAAEHLKLSGVISMLSPKALAILDASIEDFKRKEREQ